MRTAAWVALVFALGGFGASAALGQSVPVPIPTVSTPTVSLPSVSVPSVSVPSVTTPAPAPPASTPPVQTPSATTPSVQVSGAGASAGASGGSAASGGGAVRGAGTSGGSTSGASSASAASAVAGSSGGRPRAASPAPLRSSRWWIAVRGSEPRRVTTLTFRLRGSRIVRFSVMQVSPVCRLVGRFSIHGHAGVNRVRLGGRVQGTSLSPGTYRITARTRSGRIIAVTTLVVVAVRAPSPTELAFARRSNVCGSSGVLGAAAIRGSFAAAAGGTTSEEPATIVRHQRASGKPTHNGNPSESASPPRVASGPFSSVGEHAKSPLVIALLGLAVLMLGLAAVPRAAAADPRITALVVAHRVELATAGTAALLAAAVAILLV